MVDSEDNSEYDSDSMGEEDSVADPSLPNDSVVEPPPDPIVRVEDLIQMEPEDSPGGGGVEMGDGQQVPGTQGETGNQRRPSVSYASGEPA